MVGGTFFLNVGSRPELLAEKKVFFVIVIY